MKKLRCLLPVLLFPAFLHAQTLPKKNASPNYSFTNIPVKIENGHGEKVKVNFNALIPKKVWDREIQSRKISEKEFFEFIASSLSSGAQLELKNSLSFEPLKSQFFFYKDGKYNCVYKMMGRNGIGNMVETTAVVSFDPPLSDSQIHINLDSLPKKVTLPKISSQNAGSQ